MTHAIDVRGAREEPAALDDLYRPSGSGTIPAPGQTWCQVRCPEYYSQAFESTVRRSSGHTRLGGESRDSHAPPDAGRTALCAAQDQTVCMNSAEGTAMQVLFRLCRPCQFRKSPLPCRYKLTVRRKAWCPVALSDRSGPDRRVGRHQTLEPAAGSGVEAWWRRLA